MWLRRCETPQNVICNSALEVDILKKSINLFRKTIDWSLFQWGTTIPQSKIELFDNIIGYHLKRGTHVDIKLLVEGKLFDAKLINVDRKNVKNDTYQIRYDANNDLKKLLKEICVSVYEDIIVQREIEINKGNKKPYVNVSDNNYIELLSTSEMKTFLLKIYLEDYYAYDEQSNVFITESIAKQILNKKNIGLSDEEIDKRRRQRLNNYKASKQRRRELSTKVNVSNPLLKEDIKQLYSYKCQICSTQIKYRGWIPGLSKIQEYEFLSADAHHIVALSQNGEDDPSNIMCVCPNCHRKLHTGELEIVFDDRGPKCTNTITNQVMDLYIDENHSLKRRYSR